MATNRITRYSAKWLPFLINNNLATLQDIIEARRRYSESLARRMKEQREQRRRERGDC